MRNSSLVDKLTKRDIKVSLEHILDNSRANSGGERDVNFLRFLADSGLLVQTEAVLKRTNMDFPEEYYLERYKKVHFETDRHFLCRTIIQDEIKKMGVDTMSGIEAGDLGLLRSNSNYDIAASDFSCIIDVGLTPARNYFRGLTDLRVKDYLITTYFDDYIDDIVFCVFTRGNDQDFLDAIREYEEGFKQYSPNSFNYLETGIYSIPEEL